MGSVRDRRILPGKRASQTAAKASLWGGATVPGIPVVLQTHLCSMMHSKMPVRLEWVVGGSPGDLRAGRPVRDSSTSGFRLRGRGFSLMSVQCPARATDIKMACAMAPDCQPGMVLSSVSSPVETEPWRGSRAGVWGAARAQTPHVTLASGFSSPGAGELHPRVRGSKPQVLSTGQVWEET